MLHHISTHLYVYSRTGYILKKPNFSKQKRASRHRAEEWGCLNFGGIYFTTEAIIIILKSIIKSASVLRI